MMSNPNDVIVIAEDRPSVVVHSLSVHHRVFPEIRAEAQLTEDAAERLGELLTQTLDVAPCDWRRDALVRAVEDVRAFSQLIHF
jgi:hypothetical protein